MHNKSIIRKLRLKKFANAKINDLVMTFSFLFLVSLFFNIYFPVKNKIENRKTEIAYEDRIKSLHDSLTYELDYAKTLTEKCHIYTEIGRVSVERNFNYEINEDSVWNYIKSLDVWFPEYIMAQAVVESQCGKLMPYNSNNLFGMTKPNKRETIAIQPNQSNGIYARYKNWKMSVIDRVLWELSVFDNIKPTEDAYVKQLGKYAQSPTYLVAIKSKAKEYKNQK